MNAVTQMLKLRYPIIQGGMIWCAGSKLAAAVSNAGALGLIGAGSMKPDILALHLEKIKGLTQQPWGVNLPIYSKYAEEQKKLIIDSRPVVVFTSAGSPAAFTAEFKSHGIRVVHVVSSPAQAVKCQKAGVDAVVAEGFEAGGHNGADETTTMVLVPAVKRAVDIPVIAAGGIATGAQMAAAFSLGADAVQIGTRFAATIESSAHENFKQAIVDADTGATHLALKRLMPVRILKNRFYKTVQQLEDAGASIQELSEALGTGRARQGIFNGDLDEGEVEFGQTAAGIDHIPSAGSVIDTLVTEYNTVIAEILKPL